MPRIQLRAYLDPGQAEVSLNVLRGDDTYERLTGIVDTGAAVSLLPNYLLEKIVYRRTQRGMVTVEQAGIAHQRFTVTEAFVQMVLEDQHGARTDLFEARVWFTETDKVLIGFDGILDRAALYIDMRETRTGWIELD